MAILTPADRNLYFPTVSYPVGDDTNLTAACKRAQWVAESSEGANRSLELRKYSEVLRVNRSFGGCQLTYAPIAQSRAITVQARSGAARSGYGRTAQPTLPWGDLRADQWSLDEPQCRLYLRAWSGGVTWFSEVRVTYWSGFDFSENPLSYEAEQIKMAVAQILEFQEISASLRNELTAEKNEVDMTSPDALLKLGGDKIKQIEFTDDLSVSFQDTKTQRSEALKAAGGKLDGDYQAALTFLKQYQPRCFL